MDNIAKVRRDEAEAKLRGEEEERRMQEVDAERRLDLLRGSRSVQDEPKAIVTPIRESAPKPEGERRAKKRKLAGEDDTDRDIRLARLESDTKEATWGGGTSNKNVRLVDAGGHLNLFPQERARTEKNDEAEKEALKKKREYEDQYTMRFSNAAGGKEGIVRPWYSTSSQTPQDTATKDVWGNEDPLRQVREQARINSSDPLAMIKRGVKQLKEAEKQREKWKAERDRETAVPTPSHLSRRRRHSGSRNEEESLEDFSLDVQPTRSKDERRDRHRPHHRHRHDRHKDRRLSRDRSDHSHHSSSHRASVEDR